MTNALSIQWRLLIAAGLVLATQLPAWQIKRSTSADSASTPRLDVTTLKTQLGTWTGVDTEIDERLTRAIRGSSNVNRSYDNGRGLQVIVHLAVFPSAELSMPHLPTVCYKNAGWDMSQPVVHRGTDGPAYPSMTVERDGDRALIMYWYQLGPTVAGNRTELRQRLQDLRWKGERWPPLVKVLLHVPLESSEETARAEASDLADAIYRWIGENS